MGRLAIGERVAAARERVEAEGGRWGRPSRVDAATRERAVKLKTAGKTVRDIARTLKVPRSTIARALLSPSGHALPG
jgi:DNA invertase Pin-like site-specific DNA recombinase